ncbi:MAG: site-specific integrase [Sphingomonadaceae bacterium]
MIGSHSLSSSSKRAYAADLRHFRASGGYIPSTPDAIACYLADLAQTHAAATIQRRLTSIAKAHRASGHDDPTKAEIVAATMRGIRRTKGMAQREAQALQRDDLFMVLERMGNRPLDIRDKALLLIGFAGAFRRSELVGLNCDDVEHVRQGLVLHLRRSKTDQAGQGRKIAIPFGRTRWCPVRHLTDWLAHAGIERGPLFRSINRHGHVSPHRLSGEAVSIIIKRHLAAAGFDPDRYSGHSLRAGLATSAAMAGASTFKIRAQTGHKSDTMLNRYIRDGDMFTDNAVGVVL